MPTYEYRCNECGKRFDLFQKMNDKPIDTCPYCKGNVTRIIGAGMGIIFKGSGFYETDYKRNTTNNSSTKNDTKKEVKTSAKSAVSDQSSKTSKKTEKSN